MIQCAMWMSEGSGRRGCGATSLLRVNAVGVDIGIYVHLWISEEI